MDLDFLSAFELPPMFCLFSLGQLASASRSHFAKQLQSLSNHSYFMLIINEYCPTRRSSIQSAKIIKNAESYYL